MAEAAPSGRADDETKSDIRPPAAAHARAESFGLPEKYEVLRLLGKGGMGAVYLAHDRMLDRDVAIKLLSESYSEDASLASRFLAEARAVARLNHPNIVHVYDFGRAGKRYFLAMEFIDGRSFAAELQSRGTFSEAQAVAVTRKACAALAVAHAAGIVHRDVKPDNMMQTSKGEFKLVDLGLAKIVNEASSMTMSGAVVGTPYYISPEQIRGERTIDLRTDVYSLGATMYQFATGRLPFEGSSAAHVMTRHLHDPLPDPRTHVPSLSAGFCRVLLKMMAKEPADRYRDMNEVDADLALVERGGTPATPRHAAGTQMTWKRSELDPIEAALLKSVGPMARVLVARAAETCVSRERMIESLAQEVSGASARRSFLDECARSTPHPQEASAAPPDRFSTTAPNAPPTAFDAAALAKLTSLLTAQIGPVAGVLVRRAAQRAPDLGALVADLATQIPAGPAREAFVAAARGGKNA